MPHRGRGFLWLWSATLLAVCACGVLAATTWGTEIVLKDGRALRGKLGKVSGLADTPQPPSPDGTGPLQMIILVDDDLRRLFVPDRLKSEVHQEENRQLEEKFALRQRAARNGKTVKSVGELLRVQPFDDFGRRIVTMAMEGGPDNVIQGITLLTPRYAKVEGISHVWDMRIATSSIPPDTLRKILLKQINPKELEHFKKLARFYLQCQRYDDARQVLENALTAFPDRADLKEQLEPSLRAIVQLSAQERLSELKLRREAAQHRFVADMLTRFPTEGVGGEVLQGVRDMIQEYDTREARRKEVVANLKTLRTKIPDTIQRENLKPILDEIAAEIGPNTLDRMAAFLQNAGTPQMPDAEKLSLAISGWLLGADSATPKLATAISAYRVRGLIREYLNQTAKPDRQRNFEYVKLESASDPAMVADLLAHMKPQIDPPDPVAGKPGYYEIETPGLSKGPPFTYCVQLPPEYDPHRLYPTIVTLNGAATTPQQQIDWWAGAFGDGGVRTGQATRYGYIVIAPAWSVEHQRQYGYSAHEHAAVLNSLRDACRKFAIDTDRVFLSGYSMGGDAAWDLGLAHPDLWAGVIPIVAQSDRYCTLYWENARYVPFYVVAGEMDGKRLTKNAPDLDRYLKRGFDTTVVEYQGRGHEDFYEEILHVFDWMSRFRRNFFPRNFACKTMRSWDNYFWWVEIQGLPPRSLVDPADWAPGTPAPKGALPLEIEGSINKSAISVRAGTSPVTVWLSPAMIDFEQRWTITANGRRLNGPDQKVRPDLLTILEDVRTRGDRQHPFWAKLDGTAGHARAK